MATHVKKEDPKNKSSIHIPVAALKRFANDLESDAASNKFLQINRDRVSEFIDKKPHKPSGEANNGKVAVTRTFHVPGINDYSDLSSPAKKPMIQLQNRPEFDHALGSRSRFGEGDGSFFDKWLNADIAKTKHLVDKDGFPVLRFKGQIDSGFKRHLQDFNDGLDGPKQPVYVQTYAERKAERIRREQEEKLNKEKEAHLPPHVPDQKVTSTGITLPSLTRSNTAMSTITSNSDASRLEGYESVEVPLLPLLGQLSLADRESYFGSEARSAFFESYKEIAQQRFTIGLGDEEQELEALLTARTQHRDHFQDDDEGEGQGEADDDSAANRSYDSDYSEMGTLLDEHFRPTPGPSRMHSRRNVMILEDDNEDKPEESKLVRQSSTSSMKGGMYLDEAPSPSKPITVNHLNAFKKSRQSSRSRSRGPNTKRTLYSRQRQGDTQAEEEKKRLFDHLNRQAIERQNTNRPLSARSRFLLGCVQKGIFPQPSLIIRKNVTTTLSIANFGIGNELAGLLAASLATLPLLEGLSVADNNLTDAGLVPIVKALTKCTRLNSLDVSRNKVDVETAKALLLYISSPGCSLTHLFMANANVDDKEAAEFVRIIAARRNFKELDLSENQLGSHEYGLKYCDTAGVALGHLLSDPRCSLETLKLSWNMIRYKSAIELVRSLSINESLTFLDLGYNRLGAEGGDALGDALHSNRTLKVLKLAHNNITSRPCCTILSGVVSCESLVEVDLSHNPIGGYGARLLLSIDLKYGDRVKVDIRNCTLRTSDNSCWFDPVKPKKEYTLNLKEPYARCVCIELLRLVTAPNDEHTIEQFQYCGPEDSALRDINLELYSLAKIRLAELQGTEGPVSPREAENKFEEARNMYKETAGRIFRQYDVDNSGGLDRNELAVVLKQIGMEGSTAMVDQLMSIYDTDGSGLVEEEEFIAFLLDVKANNNTIEVEKPGDRFLYDVDANSNNQGRPVPYFPPNVGTVHIKLNVDKTKELVPQSVSQHSIEGMFDATQSSEDRIAIFDYALSVMKLQFIDAHSFYRVMLNEIGSSLHVLARLLPCMATPNDARMLITYATGNDFEQMHLLRGMMGAVYFVYIGLPNGFYRLSLSEPADQACLKHLRDLSITSMHQRKKLNLGDTSQDGNWLGFRNCVYDGKSIVLTEEWLEDFPTKGKLDFDFVHINTITVMDTEISHFRLFRLMHGLGMATDEKRRRIFEKLAADKEEGRAVSKGTGFRHTEIRASVMEQASNHLYKLYTTNHTSRMERVEMPISDAEKLYLRPAHQQQPPPQPQQSSKTPVVLPKPHADTEKEIKAKHHDVLGNDTSHGGFVKEMLESGSVDPAVICERMLETLKFSLAARFITSVQLALLVHLFPDGFMPCGDFSTYRVELIVSLYTRVVDIINMDFVLKELESTEYAMLLFRLGWLNIWNPIKAEGRVCLDLSRREERQLARIMLVLNFAEPGNSWQEPSFRPTRTSPLEEKWTLPASWYCEPTFPTQGILSLQYFSGRGCNVEDCAPNAACRHTLMALVLAKSYSADVWSGSKSNMDTIEFMVQKMGCSLSFLSASNPVVATGKPH